jgi:hypothetical protein
VRRRRGFRKEGSVAQEAPQRELRLETVLANAVPDRFLFFLPYEVEGESDRHAEFHYDAFRAAVHDRFPNGHQRLSHPAQLRARVWQTDDSAVAGFRILCVDHQDFGILVHS